MKICKILKYAKICEWVKIGLSPELIRDIFEFMEQQNSLRMNSQFRPREPNSGKGYHLACER